MAKGQDLHAHKEATFGHYLAARGAHPNHRIVHRWCEYPDVSAIPTPRLHGFDESYAALASAFKQGIVGEWLYRRVREHLDRARMFAEVLEIDLQGPWLAASDDGSVGVDWRHGSRRCAITFDRAGTVEFYATDALKEMHGPIETAADAMKQIMWLSRADER